MCSSDLRRSLAAFHASENADEFLVHERLFGEACTKGLGRHRFTDTVLSLSRDRAALGTFLARGSSILGIPQNRRTDPGPDHVDNLLHALAPSLRLSMNRLPPEGRLRALLLFEAVLRRVSALRRKPESLRGAESIYAGVGPALRLVARNTESITLPPPTDKTVTMVTNLRYGPLVLAAYAILKHAERVSTVECLELAFEETLSSALRSALLCELGRWVEARQDSHGKTAQPGPRP